MEAFIALESGRVFSGRMLGAPLETGAEVVFHTGMTGYQEILTDPSYRGQIVAMTYSQIGNYGIIPEDSESAGPHVRGFVVGEACTVPSNWRSRQSLPDYLAEHAIPGIEDVDTRALTKHLRSAGAMRSCLTNELDAEAAVAAARAALD